MVLAVFIQDWMSSWLALMTMLLMALAMTVVSDLLGWFEMVRMW